MKKTLLSFILVAPLVLLVVVPLLRAEKLFGGRTETQSGESQTTVSLKNEAESGDRYAREKLLKHLLREGASVAETEEGLGLLLDLSVNKKEKWAQEFFKKRLEEGKRLPVKLAKLGEFYRAAKDYDLGAAKIIGQAFLFGIPPLPRSPIDAGNILSVPAMKTGDPEAMLLLGVAYGFDNFTRTQSEKIFRKVSQDGQPELAELYTRACLEHDPVAMRLIAMLRSRKNPLLPFSSYAALYWARAASEQGDARAQLILSYIFFKDQKPVEGQAWEITAASKLKWESADLSAKKQKLTAEQIAAAEQLAEKYKLFKPESYSYKRVWPDRINWRRRGDEHYDRKGEEYAGILAYHHALRHDSNQIDSMVDLASLYWRVKNKGTAIELLEAVERVKPDHVTALYNLGLFYKNVKLIKECHRVWSHFLQTADPVKNARMIKSVKDQLGETH